MPSFSVIFLSPPSSRNFELTGLRRKRGANKYATNRSTNAPNRSTNATNYMTKGFRNRAHNIMGQGATNNDRQLPTGPYVELGWRGRGLDMALKMVQAPFSSIGVNCWSILVYCLVEFGRSCRTTKEETTKRRHASATLPQGPAECALAL